VTDAAAPTRRRGRVVADPLNVRPGLVDVRLDLAAGAQRVHPVMSPIRCDDAFAQVQVPGTQPRPTDRLTRFDKLARFHERVDVLVAEMPDVDQAANTGPGRGGDAPALDRVHAMRPSTRRVVLRNIVADGNVEAIVINRSQRGVRPGIEEPRIGCGRLCGRTGQPRHASLYR
jgi:hypothetical protein